MVQTVESPYTRRTPVATGDFIGSCFCVSLRPTSLHSFFNAPFNCVQSPPSLSRMITNLTFGSRYARSLRGMLDSRSLLPSCGTQRNGKSGNSRGNNPSSSTFMERSSSRNTILLIFIPPPRTTPVSRARPADRPHRTDCEAFRYRKRAGPS